MSKPKATKEELKLVPIDQTQRQDVLELLSRAENIIAGITPIEEKRPSREARFEGFIVLGYTIHIE